MPSKQDTSAGATTTTLSLCMIVKNEAALLGRCLASVQKAVDQIVVVDTGSTDTTVEVARRYGATVIQSDWRDDFSYSRNISIEHATGTWILWLDADDVVPESSITQIIELKKRSPDRVFGFIVRNERPGNTGTEFIQARMFPNSSDLRFERSIHEQIMPSALRKGLVMERCEVVVEHHGYAEPATLREKAARNVRLLLKEYPQVAPDVVMALEIADSYTLIDDDTAAAQWYGEVLAIPDCAQVTPVLAAHAHFGLGNIDNKLERYDSAITHFDEALQLTPWRADVLYSLAVAQELSGKSDEAVVSLRSIPSIKPKAGQVGVDFRSATIKSYLRCIRLLIELERREEAKPIVEEACKVVGHRPEIQSMAGKFYLKTESLIDALHAFERSLQIRREGNFEAYVGLCLIYYRAQRNDVARQTLDTIAPMFQDDMRYFIVRNRLLGEEVPEKLFSDQQKLEEHEKRLQREFWGML